MCSDIAIRVTNLEKCFHIYDNPSDRLLQIFFGRRKKFYREYWALKNISFSIRKGETVGIIGKNGAGKSTLLQLICGTLEPSSGEVSVKGRVAALLELGAGFNPEFSGRENVYFYGSILGMSSEEIAEKFDDILSFSELQDFIDEPVKTYSSGMFVRLAFSVAIHVSPDILIVDEALSVGDISFRNKCLERIQKMMSVGVTILFVTHDVSTLQLLCTRVFWLDGGELRASGNPVQISQDYYVATMESSGVIVAEKLSEPENHIPVQQQTGKALFTDLRILGGADYQVGQSLAFSFSLLVQEHLGPIVFAISIYRSDGDWIIGQTSRDEKVFWPGAEAGQILSGRVVFASLSLGPGDYLAAFGAYSSDFSLCYALTDLSLQFSVRSPYPTWGKFVHPCKWIVDEKTQ